MPLHDMSDIPKAADGSPPNAKPRFGHLLAELWRDEALAEPHAPSGARFRASDAAGCARYLSMKAAGIPESNPMDLSGYWNVTIGKWLHAEFDRALRRAFPGAEPEVQVRYALGGEVDEDGDGVVRIDFELHDGDELIVGEVKSSGGYGFKNAIGKAKRNQPAQGPKMDHFTQGCIGAVRRGADRLYIVYLAKECLGVSVSADLPHEALRFSAEWDYTRDQFEPVAMAEEERVAAILAHLDEEGELARRVIPGVGEVKDPKTGRTAAGGSAWQCDYCSRRDACITIGPGRVKLSGAVSLLMEQEVRAADSSPHPELETACPLCRAPVALRMVDVVEHMAACPAVPSRS